MGTSVLLVLAGMVIVAPDTALRKPFAESICETNYHAVKIGMTIPEVVAILGNPRDKRQRLGYCRFVYHKPESAWDTPCAKCPTLTEAISYQIELTTMPTTTVLQWMSEDCIISVYIDSKGEVGQKCFGEIQWGEKGGKRR